LENGDDENESDDIGGKEERKDDGLIVRKAEKEELKNVRAALIPLDLIIPFPGQPRIFFDPVELEEMAGTIKEKGGVINPIPVTPRRIDGKLRFMLISGERRWRAAKIAKIERILTHIRKTENDTEVLEEAIIANLHHRKTSLVEDAFAIPRAPGSMAGGERKVLYYFERYYSERRSPHSCCPKPY
jgi:hypothetical protein